MKDNNQLDELSNYECKKVNGGNFGWDVGWLLGNVISGNFGSVAGTVEAVTDYMIHYQE